MSYTCTDCKKGQMDQVTEVNYQARLSGKNFIVSKAKIRRCTNCNGIAVHGRELKRWREILRLQEGGKPRFYAIPTDIDTVDADYIINLIAEALAEADGEYIATIANQLLSADVKYLEDSLFKIEYKV